MSRTFYGLIHRWDWFVCLTCWTPTFLHLLLLFGSHGPLFLFEVWKLISWRFLGNECLMVDKSCILVKCTRRAYVLGSWWDSPQISGSGVVWTPVHVIPTPNTINTCHMYITIFIDFCVFLALWTGFGMGRLAITFLFYLCFTVANLSKKSPTCHGWVHKTDGNVPRTHQTSNFLINAMPQNHWDPQKMCYGWVMTKRCVFTTAYSNNSVSLSSFCQWEHCWIQFSQ